MSQRQAAWVSVGEFYQRRNAFDQLQQMEWERSRWMAWSITSPFLGKNRPKTPQQWVRFPWERQEPRKMVKIEPSQMLSLDDLFNDFQNRKK